MSACVIVAGTYRSGTSLLARFLHDSGVDMNPAPLARDLKGWHPTGSYKDSILEGGSFTGWPDYFVRRNTAGVWGIKAHNLLLAPGMLEGFLASCPTERRVLVWTTRNADQAAQSWSSLRTDLPAPVAKTRILEQVARLESIYAGWPESDRLSIEFPATATDPQAQLEGVSRLVGVPFSAAACAHIRADIPRWK